MANLFILTAGNFRPGSGIGVPGGHLCEHWKECQWGVCGPAVGRDQYKLNNLVWNKLDAATWSEMLKEFKAFVVTVRFPDMVSNDWLTIRMYPGDRTAQPLFIGPDGFRLCIASAK